MARYALEYDVLVGIRTERNMKKHINISHYLSAMLLILMLSPSCVDLVEDGIDIEYALSDASLTVTALTAEQGAENEKISYQIVVSSPVNIKSCIIQAAQPGQNGSGFDVSTPGFDDPFADHIFGTVQKNIQAFTVKYDYVIPAGINRSRLTFSIIDESGKVSTERTVEVVPGAVVYRDRKLYAKDSDFQDAFASSEGVVYPDIKTNYSSVSEENRIIQEKIDILFYYDKGANRSAIAAPASSNVGLSLSVENKTLFKKLPGAGNLDVRQVSPAELIQLTENENLLAEGSTQVFNIVVGDVIGFVTDLNAVYSLKTGLIKVTGLHPASVPHYEGVSYVLECDIIVQK
jgi:hypothetical protein